MANAHAAVDALPHHYQDWTYQCAPSSNNLAVPSCEVSQAVKIDRQGHLVTILELALSKQGPTHHVLTILAPLNLYLPSGFELAWGTHHSHAVPFLSCSRQGCLARMRVTPALLAGLKHQSRATGLFRLANHKEVRLLFSLKGFSDAFAVLQQNGPGPVRH